jgi:hypothetical protein
MSESAIKYSSKKEKSLIVNKKGLFQMNTSRFWWLKKEKMEVLERKQITLHLQEGKNSQLKEEEVVYQNGRHNLNSLERPWELWVEDQAEEEVAAEKVDNNISQRQNNTMIESLAHIVQESLLN